MDEVTEINDSGSRKRQKETKKTMNLLDMPDFALDRIIELFPPLALWRLAGVCKELRARCTSDELWEKLLKQKWGKLIDHVAYVKWQCFVNCLQKLAFLKEQRKNKTASAHQTASEAENHPAQQRWTLSSIRSLSLEGCTPSPNDSIMAFYFAIENGHFWFPARLYNHLLSHDVEACYDSRTNTFKSRRSPYGSGRFEANIAWERIRAPPVDTPPNEVHKTECLDDLKPGDHIEIQWKQTQTSSYDWWYAVLGHLDSCDWNQNHCHCEMNEMIMVEFRQYSAESPWRRVKLFKSGGLRNQDNLGTYGGIRKLCDEEEISLWKSICDTGQQFPRTGQRRHRNNYY